MKAAGEPAEAERDAARGLGVPVSEEALGAAYLPPQERRLGPGPEAPEEAGKLLDAAGWTVKNGVRVNDKASPQDRDADLRAGFERVIAPYLKNLKLLGIDARIRMVDAAQYQQRLKDFDFDLTTQRYVMRNTPGVELRSYFGSAAAEDGRLARILPASPTRGRCADRADARRQEPRGA